ncbi:MAG TPA: hypothetical protein PK788_10640, partial [Gemmatimonadaceae bacterium]|nr:hypothetical protein [Gemmatimonadaceae bacterium]
LHGPHSICDLRLDEATRDVPRTLLGAGYGSSHRLLQDIFPGLKHGNFHTVYLQLWVESGVFALLTYLAILFATWRRAGALRGLVIGFVLYGITYQGMVQPALWILIALVWATELQRRVRSVDAGVTVNGAIPA